MDFLEAPAHPKGIQAELTQFLEQHRQKQMAMAPPAQPPVADPLTERVKDAIVNQRG